MMTGLDEIRRVSCKVFVIVHFKNHLVRVSCFNRDLHALDQARGKIVAKESHYASWEDLCNSCGDV